MDALIAWVDGSDPVFQEKIARYRSAREGGLDDVAGSTRYASIGEILWCVVSINRFAKGFIDRILILTDGQDPALEGELSRIFPEGFIPMRTVSHETIFKGYEEYLPVFNSRAIETLMWNIPDLSEKFVYFNDDFLLAAPVTEEDFFTADGGVVCYGDRYSALWTKILQVFKPVHRGHRRVSYKASMLEAWKMVGKGQRMIRINHTPRALLKSVYRDYYSAHPEAVVRNVRHRFRDSSQYNTQELFYLLARKEGRCVLRSPRGRLFYFMPKEKKGYLQRKMALLMGHPYKFVCFNSLDHAAPEDRAVIENWIEGRLGL